MPMSVTSSSPPLTPLPSDLSDMGSLSDSDWCDVVSSDRDGDSDTDDNEALNPSGTAPGSALNLLAVAASNAALEPAPTTAAPVSADQVSPNGSFLVDSVMNSVVTVSEQHVQPFFVATESVGVTGSDNSAATAAAVNPHGSAPTLNDGLNALRLEFPDPLSSVEEMPRPNPMFDSTSTVSSWPAAEMHTAKSQIVGPVDLHLVVIGHRPSPLRTQRVVSMFVDAVAETLATAQPTQCGLTTPKLFGLRELVYADKESSQRRIYRVLVTDDQMDEDVIANNTLALVFFSATRVLNGLPAATKLPKHTRYIPLFHSPSGAFTPSVLNQSRTSLRGSVSDDGWSVPSSVESSVLTSSGHDSVGHVRRQRVEAEWLSLGIDAKQVVNVWPRGMANSPHVVVPLTLFDRQAAARGVRKAVFHTEDEVEETPAEEVQEFSIKEEKEEEKEKEEKQCPRAALTREHSWGAFAVLSMFLAVLGSRVFQAPTSTTVHLLNVTTSPTATLSTTTTSLANYVPPSPPSVTPTQKEANLIAASLRNLAMSVISTGDEAKDAAPAPVKEQAVPPSTSTPCVSATEAAATTTPVAPLTIDPPSLKSRIGGFLSATPTPVASTSKHVEQEPESINAAVGALLNIVERRVKEVAADFCLGQVESPTECAAARNQRAATNARKLGKAALDVAARTAPDVAERILARHKRARHNARRVREAVAGVAVQVRDWTTAVSTHRRAAREERRARRAKVRAARQAAKESLVNEAAEACRPKLFCSLMGRERAGEPAAAGD